MAGKFIELNEAAKMLGMSPDQLKELRDAGEIHGYRDGASWKFKPEEIERVAQERGAGGSGVLGGEPEPTESDSALSFSDEDLDSLINLGDSGEDLDSDDDLDASSILISDEGAKSESGSSSTVIGKEEAAVGEESDLKLSGSESEIRLADSGSAILSGSSLDDESDLKLVDEGGSGGSGGESDLKLSDEENLSEEFALSDDEFSLSDELELESEEADLALSDDDDLLLGGDSGSHGDEVTLGGGDSGIGLGTPADSGLSLESEADLGSGSSLELPEDDDMIALSGDMAGMDDATQLKQDEEFMLTPSDELMGDESSDSGSQVIALEDSEAFDDDAAVMVPDEGHMFEEEGLQPQMAAVTEPVGQPVAVAAVPEAPYSWGYVVALLLIVMFLGLTGMLMTDVVRNMWSWDGQYSASTSLMEAIIGALGMN